MTTTGQSRARTGGGAGKNGPKTRRVGRRAPRAVLPPVERPLGYTPRRGNGLTGYERVLVRAGFGPVAGIDEAGRGACAGPLVVAAVVLDRLESTRWAQVADSKLLTAKAREEAYAHIVKASLAWNAVIIGPGEIDRRGLHVCNVAGMRQALAGLSAAPGYVLTDGFAVPGLAAPALAMWKGDQVAVCVAAASIVAKVTRDRIMSGLHGEYPEYGFSRHKGYSTPSHMAALDRHGPSPVHRRSFVNVSRRLDERLDELLDPAELMLEEGCHDDVGQDVGQDDAAPSWESSGRVLAGSAVLDSGREGPIVELIAGSKAAAAVGGSGLLAHAPASSEGRT
jgi:ribonuclease HII